MVRRSLLFVMICTLILAGVPAFASAASFDFTGFTKYANATNMSNVNVSIEIQQFLPGGPPVTIGVASVLSGDEGNFTLFLDAADLNPMYSYKPVLVKYSGGLSQYIGQSLPGFDYFGFIQGMNNSPITFYLKPAVTVDLSAIGIEHGTQDVVNVQNITLPANYLTGLKAVNESNIPFWAYVNASDCLIMLNASFEVNRTFCELNISNVKDVAYYPPDNSYLLINRTRIEKCTLGIGGMNCTTNATLVADDEGAPVFDAGGIDFVLPLDMFYISAKKLDSTYITLKYHPNLTLEDWIDRDEYTQWSARKLFYYNNYIYEVVNASGTTKVFRCSVVGDMCEDTVTFPSNINIDGLARNPFNGRWYYSSSTTGKITYIEDPYTAAFSIFYQVKDTALGYPIKETFSLGGTGAASSRFSLPADRNYSLMIYPNNGPAFPGKLDLNSLSEGTNISIGGRNATLASVSGALYLNLSNVNMTTEFVHLSGYVLLNSSESDQNYTNMTVIAYLIEGGNMVFKGATLPQNMGTWQWPPINDVFNTTTGFYNMTLPASAIGANLMLFASVTRNISGEMRYLGSFRTTTLNYGQIPAQLNFTLYPLLGSPLNLTLGFEGKEGANKLLTNLKEMVIQNGSGTRASQAHIEIELSYPLSQFPGSDINFSWMADANQDENGSITIPLLNWSVKKIAVYSSEYAPLKKSLSIGAMQGSSTNVTLTTFDPKGVDGSDFGDIMMMMYTNRADGSCSIPVPSISCFPGSEMSEGEFNPFSLVIGGGKIDFEIKKSSNNITVRYINVDLLASGPPDALFDSNSNNSASGSSLEEAWRFGSLGPEIYEYVLLGVPYNTSSINESADMRINITKFYDENWDISWQQGINGTASLAGTDYADYAIGSYAPYINGSGVLCSSTDANLTTGICYKDLVQNLLWFKIPHFSGIGPSIVGAALASPQGGGSDTSSSGGGSSGSGGGGGEALPFESFMLQTTLGTGDSGTFTYKKSEEIAVSEIIIEAGAAAKNPTITVRETTKGKAIAEPVSNNSGRIYKYLSITKAGITAVNNATIKFSVPLSWFANNSLDLSTVAMQRLVSDNWEKLPTKQAASTGGFANYEAVTGGFSIFSITAEKAKAKPQAANTTPVQVPAAAESLEAPTEEQPKVEARQQQPGEKGNLFAAIIGIVTALFGAAVVIASIVHRKQGNHSGKRLVENRK